jgi:hypothetical protein
VSLRIVEERFGSQACAVNTSFSGTIIPEETTVTTGLFVQPASPPPATGDTAAMFAVRRKTRLFIIQSEAFPSP